MPNFEGPSQKRIEDEYKAQRAEILHLRDRVLNASKDLFRELPLKDVIREILNEEGVRDRARRVYLTNQVTSAVNARLRAERRKQNDSESESHE